MRFKLLNTNRFYLPGTGREWLHLASVGYGVREFMAFMHCTDQQVYIEEITGGRGPDRIEDDQLAEALAQFLTEKRALLIDRPALPDQEWYTKKPQ